MDDLEVTLAPPPNPFLGIKLRSLIPIALLMIIPTAAIAVQLNVWDIVAFGDPAGQMLAFTLWFYGTLTAWCMWQARRQKISVRYLFRLPPKGYSWSRACSVVFPVILANLGIMQILFAMATYVVPDLMIDYYNSSQDMFTGAGSNYPVAYFAQLFLGLVILAPLVEELFFRGFLLNMWSVRRGVRAGIILSAMVFALAHIVQPGSFFLGLATAVLFVNTGSLAVPIVLHFLNNASAVGLQLIITAFAGNPEVTTIEDLRISAIVMGVPLLVIGLVWLAFFLWRNFPNDEGLWKHNTQFFTSHK